MKPNVTARQWRGWLEEIYLYCHMKKKAARANGGSCPMLLFRVFLGSGRWFIAEATGENRTL